MSHRARRLSVIIKKEISDMIQNELKDPGIGFASITEVDVSGDLRYAKIYISVLGDQEQKQSTLEAFKRAQGFIRTELAKRIKNLRYVPELQFELDSSMDYADKIMSILNKMDKKELE
ncbi:MAG: 30S ribosome-binding factor RbfA [Desulfotomaculum sp.]|nr:30S ribosome-binding factor RbfA [Desulfotomaculum sp.]MCL0032352.1 30S ribosome-binding factor RbfA [Peptococcaceae bacterium]MCL0052450.1 30S ribosome-binding factor RbfA [Peptococcaceae bacterium]MCL0063115.1 30S ribosome-binding factor RbfA [Peptococcaceae bacterium]